MSYRTGRRWGFEVLCVFQETAESVRDELLRAAQRRGMQDVIVECGADKPCVRGLVTYIVRGNKRTDIERMITAVTKHYDEDTVKGSTVVPASEPWRVEE